MPKILIGGDAKQPAAGFEAGRKLEVGNIGASVAAAQPVLFLGKIVMANARAMQPAQRRFGGTEIGDIAVRLGQMERHAVDEAAHECLPAGPQQLRPGVQVACQRQRAALACEQMTGKEIGPPRHLVEPAQYRIDFPILAVKPPTLDGGKHVALQQNAFGPTCRQNGGIFFGQAHGTHAAAAMRKLSAIHRSRSASARALIACFFATVFSLPRRRVPSGFLVGGAASGGNSPKLMFIGWKERGPASMVSIWPPVICPSSDPNAVVAGGGVSVVARASAAA